MNLFKSLPLVLALCLAAPAVAAPPPAAQTAPGALAYLSQDASSLEKAIAKFLKEKYKLTALFRFKDKEYNDLILVYRLAPPNTPAVPVVIDSVVSARNGKTKKVTAQVVKIVFFHPLAEKHRTPAMRARLLELNNRFNLVTWVPASIALSPKGDRLIFASYLSLPNPQTPLQLELVNDTLKRMVGSWQTYYTELKKVLMEK